MLQFTAECDLSGFRRSAARTRTELRSRIGAAVTLAAEAGVQEAKQVGGWKDRTGALRRDIRIVGRASNGTDFDVVIASPQGYASFIEAGTAPHRIQARRAQALRFVIGGDTIFRFAVNHPGTRAYPYMGPALLKAERALYAELDRGFVSIQSLWN